MSRSVLISTTRKMSKLSQIPKTASFSKFLDPDDSIPTPELALANENNVIHTPRILDEGAFSYTLPEKRKEYQFLTASENALKDLGLELDEVNDKTFQQIVSGEYYNDENNVKNLEPFPYSQAYAGWQFGQFAGQLGDGRVVNLFEIPKKLKDDWKTASKYEFQLKGAGKTPFSRFADGKAVIRSSIREYIISEHLNAIGIPTTRALSLTYLPQTLAQRHMAERCAVVSRFAESWIRLGTFDLYRWRADREGIRKLSDYVIQQQFTVEGEKFPMFNELLTFKNDFFDEDLKDNLTDYDKMYYETVIRNAYSTPKWQAYGFLNGVLNTDNTSILGLSMDYGPFSIMDKFDPKYTPNSEDHESRYGYRNTPTAIWWNLTRFGETLAELIGGGPNLVNDETFKNEGIKPEWEDDIIKRATKIIEIGGQVYTYAFTKKYVETFFNRLGLSNKLINIEEPDEQNKELITPLLQMLEKVKCDYNKFFLILQTIEFDSKSMDFDIIGKTVIDKSKDLNELYDDAEIKGFISDWLTVYKKYLEESEKLGTKRVELSSQHNPLFLPRNWILDEVIDSVQDSKAQDISYLKKLEKMSFNPYDKSKWGDDHKDLEERWLVQGDMGDNYSMLQCSCSS